MQTMGVAVARTDHDAVEQAGDVAEGEDVVGGGIVVVA